MSVEKSILGSALLRAARCANERLEFLSEASRLLAGSLDVQATLDKLAGLIVPRIADWCRIDLVDEQGRLELRTAADVEPEKARLVRRMRRLYPPKPQSDPAYRVLRTGRAELVPLVDDAVLAESACSRHHLRLLKSLGAGSFICVPLTEHGRNVGVLTVGDSRGRGLTKADVRLVKELGLRASAALSNALLYQKAHAAEENLGRALDAARMVAWDWDLRSGAVTRSKRAAEIFGVAARARAGEDLAHIHPEDRPARAAAVRRAIAGCGRYVARYRLVRPGDAAVLCVDEHGSVRRGADGRPARATGLLVDVTSARESEQGLRRQQADQELILDTVDAMIWYKDDNNRIVRCNRAAARWAGRRVESIEGRSAYDVFPQEEARAFHEDDLRVLRSGQPTRGVVVESLTPEGEKRWIRRDKIPFRDAVGRAGLVIFALDITEMKRAEESLRQSEALQREFLANVSHEFRTPVAAIRGFAETLRRGGLEDTRNRARFVRGIESQTERLGWLIEDMLNLSVLDAGKPLALAPVNLPELLAEYVRSLAPVTDAGGLRVDVRVPAGFSVVADQFYLLQVLEILVNNAVSFNRPGGRIVIAAKKTVSETHIEVRDTGVGIPRRALPRVFEPFFKVRKGASGSTGLGLHIAKRIVERHGGRVWAHSSFGKGSSFNFSLPKTRARATAS
jgi:PAS domain S-box-containing protein